jgi:predicted ribosome quality control (RQC) complex YloA/Tae2 family protein
MKVLSFNDVYTIKIGQNQYENQELLESMNPEHTWFHVSDVSSPHLIIDTNYETLSKVMIYKIAILLKQNTKYRKENNIDIDYTLRKNLQLTKTPGMVHIKGKYYTIKV